MGERPVVRILAAWHFFVRVPYNAKVPLSEFVNDFESVEEHVPEVDGVVPALVIAVKVLEALEGIPVSIRDI